MIRSFFRAFALLVCCLSLSEFAAAANIHFDKSSIGGVRAGDRFILEILGDAFDGGSSGGGLNLRWNANFLTVGSLDDVELRYPGDVFIFDKGRLDNDAGHLLNIATNSFKGINDLSFVIAKITFTALAEGTSLLELETGTFSNELLNVWTDASGLEIADLSFSAAEVAVIGPVPLPAGLWLMPGALALLGLRSRASSRHATA